MNPVSDKFIQEVLSYVRYKKIHSSIEIELKDHINCLKQSYIDEGLEEDEAYQKAVLQMGEAEDIGKSLNKAHKPRMEWSVLILIIGIIGIGLMTLFFAESYETSQMFRDRFTKQIIWTALGGIALVTMYLIDYQYFVKWDIVGYVLGIGILIYALHFGQYMNGSLMWITIGFVKFNYVELALPILIISYVGIIHRLGHEQMKDYLILGIIALGPILLIVKKSFTSAMLIGICLLIVITVYVANSSFKGKRVKLLGGIYGGVGILGVLMVSLFSMQPHRLERLKVFLNPQLAPVEGGYEIIQMKIIRENASFLGGRGLEVHPIGYLPEATSNRIFTFIIGSMGWLMGVFLIVMIAFVIVRMFKTTTKIQDGYGKLLSLSIATLFALQFIINIGMNLGFFPPTSMGLPFVSYGGTSMIVNGMLIGIFLSIYRKKDIILLQETL